MTLTYRIALLAVQAFVCGYGRLNVLGAKHIPRQGPVLIVANHDSPLDALIISAAAGQRQVRFVTKRSLWKRPLLGHLLDRLDQIAIDRGRHDNSNLDAAVAALRDGHCVCVFPEGTLSRGQPLRIRSGAARLLASVPDTTVVGCAVTGATVLARRQYRADVRVVFFTILRNPSAGDSGSTVALVQKVMEVIRRVAPPTR